MNKLKKIFWIGFISLFFMIVMGAYNQVSAADITYKAEYESAISYKLTITGLVEEPEKYVELFAAQGADMISVHVEATPHIHRVIQQIKNTNVKAGVVINTGTSVNTIMPVLKMVDYVLVMTVNPGFGGQTFIQDSISKLDELVKIKKALNLSFEIEVDGGINDETVATVIEHGATMLVAGSYFFKQKDYKQVTQTLKG